MFPQAGFLGLALLPSHSKLGMSSLTGDPQNAHHSPVDILWFRAFHTHTHIGCAKIRDCMPKRWRTSCLWQSLVLKIWISRQGGHLVSSSGKWINLHFKVANGHLNAAEELQRKEDELKEGFPEICGILDDIWQWLKIRVPMTHRNDHV